MKKSLVFAKYVKTVFPHFNGMGTAFHQISAEYPGTAPIIIKHAFGNDERLNELVKLNSIKASHKKFLAKQQPVHSNEYMLGLTSKDIPNDPVIREERSSKPQEKRFSLPWRQNFGSKKKAMYTWVWSNPVMFSALDENTGLESSLKVTYPTKLLIYQLAFHTFYPMENAPTLIKISPSLQKTDLGVFTESNEQNTEFPHKITWNKDMKVFKLEINNPIVGDTYIATWNLGIRQMLKYIAWLEANQ